MHPALVDFHLERGLRLHTEPEHKNLYTWAINEIDTHGRVIGRDQIPWVWTLYFTATSCDLLDSIEINSVLQKREAMVASPEISQRQVIRVQLRSGDARYGRDATSYTMFGTDRAIKSIQLDIHPIASPTEHERCTAWGSVSYTTELDFRNVTNDDCVAFYLFVKPDRFARYAAMIEQGLVDEMILRVEFVAGFYSEWSPSISTTNVKVLTPGDEQKINLPPGLQFEPPRLGQVGAAELYVNRHLEFGKSVAEPEAVGKIADFEREPEVVDPHPLARADTRVLDMLRSLRRAAWFIAGLLGLISIVTLLKQ
jgi:hypothetical protein